MRGALKAVDQAIALAPESAESWFQRGRYVLTQQRAIHPEVKLAWRKARALGSAVAAGMITALENLEEAISLLGDADARAHLEMLINTLDNQTTSDRNS